MRNYLLSIFFLVFTSFQAFADLTSCEESVSHKKVEKTVSCYENIKFPANVFLEYCKTGYFFAINDPDYTVVHNPVEKCGENYLGVCKNPGFPSFGDRKPIKMGFSIFYYKNVEVDKIKESCISNGGEWLDGEN